MTEQTEQTPATQQIQAAPAQPINSEAASLLSSLGPFLVDADRAELQTLAGNEQAAPATEPPTAQATATGEPAAVEGTDTPAGEKQEPAPEVKEEKPEPAKKSVLGINKKKTEQKSDLVIETPEHILTAIKSKYGQEYKDIKDLPKFFESVDKMRAAAQKVEDTTTKLSAIEQEIMALPVEFHEAIRAYQSGQDYRTPFIKPAGIDYNKPSDKQDVKALVNHYFPGDFADTDFTDEEKSKALKIAESAAITKFNAEKLIHDTKRADVASRAEKNKESQRIALDSSVKGLQERFPEMDTEAFNQVKSALEGGPQKVLSLFFNNDGTAKPDAAVKLTMSLFGESELLPDAMEVAAHIAETKINEDLLTRAADGPKPNRSNGGQPEQIPAEIKKQIDDMTRIADAKKKVF